MVCKDRKLVGMVARYKGAESIARIPFNSDLDLRAEELSFQYRTSQN